MRAVQSEQVNLDSEEAATSNEGPDPSRMVETSGLMPAGTGGLGPGTLRSLALPSPPGMDAAIGVLSLPPAPQGSAMGQVGGEATRAIDGAASPHGASVEMDTNAGSTIYETAAILVGISSTPAPPTPVRDELLPLRYGLFEQYPSINALVPSLLSLRSQPRDHLSETTSLGYSPTESSPLHASPSFPLSLQWVGSGESVSEEQLSLLHSLGRDLFDGNVIGASACGFGSVLPTLVSWGLLDTSAYVSLVEQIIAVGELPIGAVAAWLHVYLAVKLRVLYLAHGQYVSYLVTESDLGFNLEPDLPGTRLDAWLMFLLNSDSCLEAALLRHGSIASCTDVIEVHYTTGHLDGVCTRVSSSNWASMQLKEETLRHQIADISSKADVAHTAIQVLSWRLHYPDCPADERAELERLPGCQWTAS